MTSPGEHGLRTLPELLYRAAERFPERPGLLAPRMTYGQLAARVERLAGGLAELGVERGARLAVILPSGPELLQLWLALARLGAVMVPLDPALTLPEVRSLLGRADVVGTAAAGSRLATLDPVWSGRLALSPEGDGPAGTARERVAFAELASAPPCNRPLPAGAELASLLYTSGTTGRPKGVGRSHESLVLPAHELSRALAVGPEDRLLGCLPLFHLAGQAFAATALAGAAALAQLERFAASRFWDQVAAHRITLFRYIGEMLAVLCRAPAAASDRDHGLRAVYGGGAAPEVAREFERRFGTVVVEGYGLTETNTVLRNTLAERRPGSIGRPPAYGRVRVADAAGRALGPGEVGELQVARGPVLTRGYEGDRELTESVFDGEWFKTGDLGWYDAEGFFYFAGRRKDVIRRRGENVAPGEVEGVLAAHPAVEACAVVGVPDEVGGEEVKAYVVLRAEHPVRAAELWEWCARSLAPFKVPRFLELCARLPMTATHKVQKERLKVAGPHLGTWYDQRQTSDPQRRFPDVTAAL